MGGVSFGPCPWHEFVDARCGPEIDELVEDVGVVGLRLDVVELARLDQRRDAGPVFGPLVMTSEERALCSTSSGIRSSTRQAGKALHQAEDPSIQ
jgi:hypothetical protein